MAGLHRNTEGSREGKYLVQRRDGTIPQWPWFVLGAADEDAADTLRDYANRVEKRGLDPKYVADLPSDGRRLGETVEGRRVEEG
jgi:hypothetical protein